MFWYQRMNLELVPASELQINLRLRAAYLRLVGELVNETELKAVMTNLDTLSIEEQNSRLNTVTSVMINAKSKGI